MRFVVKDNIPLPARSAGSIVAAVLGIQRKAADRMVYDGLVWCDGKPVAAPHQRLSVGSTVEIEQLAPLPKQKHSPVKAQPQRFEVLHNDDDIVVVSKPAGMLTVPTRSGQSSLMQQLGRHLSNRTKKGRSGSELTCVQRIDRWVSGPIVFAKHTQATESLREQLRAHSARRSYVAIVAGTVAEEAGTIDTPLDVDGLHVRTTEPGAGQSAVSHFRTGERLLGASVLEVTLETGRRNQIRAHLAHIGHPVIGDPRYRAAQAQHAAWPHKRIALHGCELVFHHPATQHKLTFELPWPKEFGAFVKQQRRK
ncbi:MAG TPA: hypothetical protein DDW52_09220 [Planctomycetaceae bacterium]|nr:hypothetical protein [Planctomycetaceae bacterium]